jgi:non-ribosomal peptide synthetase-like protein
LTAIFLTATFAMLLALAYAAWRRYLWAAEKVPPADNCPYSLTDVFGERPFVNVPHQKGVKWLTEVFSRSAQKFPHLTALHIPHTGESLTFSELDARAENVAAAISSFLTGPDQVVAVVMSQDNWQIVACHLGILKAGGTVMFLDATLPDALITHMLNDAQPALILTRGQEKFRDLPTLDVLTLTERIPRRVPPPWLDDPTQRLATIFYTSGTTGMPKGVECPHAGYVNLALSYADYFDLLPGMDATSLTASLGYDGSISEMYSAWVSGCAVVMLTKEQIRSGPELVHVLRDAEVTVLFCPPVLLTTLTPTPELDLPYPLCRYVVPAGEAFPSVLVEPWTRGRRQIINTYGPTEASTDTSRQSLRPGEPITIGSPFPNVTYVILEVDQLRPLPHGEIGELCIGGVHVARGYRNQPEQTAQKFITHPQFGRLYRTGDKCKIDIQARRVHFLGRIDAQLKVRGHRVEAQAVEDILQGQFSEIEAAVLDYQNETLVAFVAAPSLCQEPISGVAPAPTEWAARVTSTLAQQLPAPAVPTDIFLVEKFVMKPVSGKIDRKCLPNLSRLLKSTKPEARQVTGDLSENADHPADIKLPDADRSIPPECEEVLAICRTVFEKPLGLDDGFIEAGGHSIVIARLAQKLQAAGWVVPVRTLLTTCNTARKVASHPRALQEASKVPQTVPLRSDKNELARNEARAEVLSIGYFTTLQLLFAMLFYSPALVSFLVALTYVQVATFFTTANLLEFIIADVALYLLGLIVPFACLLWVMLIKFAMGGEIYRNNVTPGVYPKWSKMHLRIWCIGRMENMARRTMAMYRSAPLTAFALRQLGATVGSNLQCAHDAHLLGPLDLISIENDVAIQSGAYIQATRWSGEGLHIGPIRIESGCKIGMRAAVANDVAIGRGTWITPFTPILSDVGSQEIWEGAPARLSGRCTELRRTADFCRYAHPIWLLETLKVVMHIFLFFCLNMLPIAVIAWAARAYTPAGNAELSSDYFSITPLPELIWDLTLYAFIAAWASIVLTSSLGCLFIRCTAASPGLYPSRGLKGALLAHRMDAMNAIQRQWTWTITGQYLRALAGMRFARLGASECDLMINLVPELATAGSQVFWSNSSLTNMLDYGAEHYTLRQLDMPESFFCGNNCVAEYGQFPANFLLGVSTPSNDILFRRQMRSRLDNPVVVAGNPPVKLASVSVGAENNTYDLPHFGLFLSRVLLFDLFSIGTLRITEGLIFTILFISMLRLGVHSIAGAAIALLLTGFVLVFSCVAIKKLLVGDWGSNSATPFWSGRHFAYFFAQDCFFVWCRTPLGFCAGTILANTILRWMGCQIGRRTIVNQPMQCSDWNAVSFGNDCLIDGFLQYHTFENTTLTVKRTYIKDGSTVAFGSTVMGGAVIERDTTLLPLSMVLKEMNLLTATYEGSPAEPVSGSILLPPSALPFSDTPAEENRLTSRLSGQMHGTTRSTSDNSEAVHSSRG